jgi:serine/threonine protein kinase/tetratricopeptide (TPR) repeat protein
VVSEKTVTTPEVAGLPDRFRVERELGRGGMSVVFRAHDARLDRFVAIKVLSEAFSSGVDTERFQREIAVMAKLSHPGIVSVFDSGVANGRLYYVMPFVPGESLRARLVRERRLSLEDASTIAADVADALAFAHDAKIVHRDVKPENIFMVAGRALLGDFGIARTSQQALTADAQTLASTGQLTTAGVIIGTPLYMSPEQVAGEAVDGRSDIYSLGCVLYEALTGATPFTGATAAILGQHLSATPRPLHDHDAGVAPAVAELVMRMLAKDPHDRPASAADIASALRHPRPASPVNAATAVPSQADRLVALGVDALRRGGSGDPSSRSNLDQAEVYLKRALAIDPNHARALCLYGNWHFVMNRLGFLSAEANGKGTELLLAALAADDQVAEVHASLAKRSLYYDDDCHAAARHIARAVALDPRDSEVLRAQSIILKILGHTAEAVAAAAAAVALEPRMPQVVNAYADALRAAGRHHEAVAALRTALQVAPAHVHTLERMERELVQVGDVDAGVDFRLTRLRVTGAEARASQLERDREECGAVEARRRDLRRALDQMLTRTGEGDPLAHHPTGPSLGDRIALAYSDLTEWLPAVTWIERAYARSPNRLRRLLMDQPFDRAGLATEPRYVRLLRVAGLNDLL